jgi:sodium-coupled monocarboxylate transporter 8/12
MAVASAGINALATTVLIDFGKVVGVARQTERGRVGLARSLTVGFGLVVTLLGLGLGHTDRTLIDSIFIIQGLFGGPSLGIFLLGVLSRRANGAGALLGAAAGAVAGGLIGFSKQLFDYPLSLLWIAFASAAVTYLVGLLASLAFPAPGPAQLALVYGSGYKSLPASLPTGPEVRAAGSEGIADREAISGEPHKPPAHPER